MKLTEENINYIIKDITYRGIVDDELGEELVDHICTIVEQKMEGGERFIEAYDQAITTFGNNDSILHLQNEKVKYPNNNYIMIGSYFKVAFRNLTKHKFYSIINIAGLAVGVACGILIYLFVSNELSYDTFHENSDRTYRITRHGSLNATEFHNAVAAAPMAFSMVSDLPEVEQAVRFRTGGAYFVQKEGSTESTKEKYVGFTDSTFFDIFPFQVLEGGKTSALARPNTVAISQEAATKFFRDESPLGNILTFDDDEKYEVTAVFENMPANSHMKFDFLLSMSSLDDSKNNMWLSNNFYTYFRLQDGVDPEAFTVKLNKFYESKIEPELQRFAGVGLKEFKSVGNFVNIEVQPLSEIYLTSNFTFDIGKTGNQQSVYLFIAIAIFIISLACINFMNLSTARSANRAKEVGVRKALGSYRSHLVRQFLTESILLSMGAFLLSLLIVLMVLPGFNLIAERSLALPFSDISFLAILIGSSLLVGIIAGFYPAFYLSSFNPVNTLKGRLNLGAGNSALRSSLVVFQFFVSVVLIIGTLVVQKQLRFIQEKKVGFNKEQVLVISDTYMLGDSRDAFKEEVSKLNQVTSASYSGFLPINGYNRSDQMYWKKGVSPGESSSASTQIWRVDEDYIQTMGMELIEGRTFNVDIASDSSAIILNEAALRKFAFNDGEERYVETYSFDDATDTVYPDRFDSYRVIGVVKDFHYESLKENIGPLAFRLGRSTGVMSIRLSTDDFSNTLNQVEEKWNATASDLPFNYSFLDDGFDNMYRQEARLGTIFGIFSVLAILIGCLGLFALATFMAEQRIKEIGIRKVLGASVRSLVLMLTKDFSKLIVIAFILAAPLAWWLLSQWLDDYNYRIELTWDLFLIAGLIAFVIAWATVSYQSIKAALSNPVDSLKND